LGHFAKYGELDLSPETKNVPVLCKACPWVHFWEFGMSKKLFVGGLSWGTNDDGLRQAFESFGEVEEVRVITDRETGRSRGFGFVTFTDGDAADRAVSEMDGKEIDGRSVKVSEAEDKPRGPRGGGGGNRGGGGGGGGNRW
jgi:cold-inducible RNA-binding protein